MLTGTTPKNLEECFAVIDTLWNHNAKERIKKQRSTVDKAYPEQYLSKS